PPEEPQDPPCTITSCPTGYVLDSENCACVKDPCDKNQQNTVKTQFTDPYLAGRLSQVRTSLEPPNTSIETGFAIYKDANGNNSAPKLITGTDTEHSISIGFQTTYPGYTPSAILHSHPSGGYASASAGDIYGLAVLHTSINTVTTSYIVAADGSTYAMVVTDPAALDSFLSNYPASENQSNE
ncbi:hypothetical protein B6A10_16330, partial [Flavobacterium sp. L1I52]